MNPILEIFSQGEEITRGQIADTNAAWLSEQSVQLGFTVTRHTAVGDKLDDLVALLQEIAVRADCCLCTGGLGPTSDDLTTEAVAKAFNLPLVFDDIAYGHIQQYFINRNRTMPASNAKQALLPTGAERLDNAVGTAPGFAVKIQRCWFAFMPGVPSEMRHIYQERVLPTLRTRFSLQPNRLVTLKTLGVGESALQEYLTPITIPDNVQLGFRAAEDVQVKLLFPYDYPETASQALIADIAQRLGDCVYAIDDLGKNSHDLVGTITPFMHAGNHKLAVIETISQGLLAAKCIGTEWLLSARYEQTLSRLQAQFNIEDRGNDLALIAHDLAQQLQQQHGVDTVLIQLHNDDHETLHNKDKPVTVHTLIRVGDHEQHAIHTIAGTLERKQKYAALMSLDVMRRFFFATKASATLATPPAKQTE